MFKPLFVSVLVVGALLVADGVLATCRDTLPFKEAEIVWGRVGFPVPEEAPATVNSRCDEPYSAALITGDVSDHFVGAYLWRDDKFGTRSRELGFSFQIPSEANLAALDHVSAQVAYEEPDPRDLASGYGRFGAAIRRDTLFVEYMMTGDPSTGCPAVGDWNLFAPVNIRGGLRAGV